MRPVRRSRPVAEGHLSSERARARTAGADAAPAVTAPKALIAALAPTPVALKTWADC